jgi:hypothetical protein
VHFALVYSNKNHIRLLDGCFLFAFFLAKYINSFDFMDLGYFMSCLTIYIDEAGR